MTPHSPRRYLALLAAMTLALPSCSSDEDQHEHDAEVHEHDGGQEHDGEVHQHDGGENLDEEGCEHTKSGPFVEVTAGTDAAGAAEVGADHKAYKVALTADQAGWVKLSATNGAQTIYRSAAVPLSVTDDQGTAVTLEGEETVTACAEVDSKVTFESETGLYFIKLGPTSATEVILVLESGEHQHE